MYISRVTISGFKSFATKTSFGFDRGVAAIVGPNGSGKSNVADAIRWAFGEQSPRALRVRKSEEVIFAGTGKRARGSVAEVTVVFDNSEGALAGRGAEIELGRKLYGSGESEYRLNGKKVRLQAVQELLAQARIGAGSYAIIGQGTIDGLVTSTPAERKLLFEEASGIREFELQREQALRRMRSTADNIGSAQAVLAELEPRLEHLGRSLEAARRRDELAVQVTELEAQLEAARYQELRNSSDVSQGIIAKITVELKELAAKRSATQARLNELSAQQRKEQSSRQAAARSLDRLEAKREHLVGELGLKRAELAYLEERQQEGDTLTAELERITLALVERKLMVQELQVALKATVAEHRALEAERQKSTQSVKSTQAKLVAQRKELSEAAPHEYIAHAQGVLGELTRSIGAAEVDVEAVKLLAYKARRLLTLAAQEGQGEVIETLKRLQSELTTAIRLRELTEERYTAAALKLQGQELNLEAAKEQLKALMAEQKRLTAAIKPFAAMGEHATARAAEIEELQRALEESRQEIEGARQLLRSQQSDGGERVELTTQLETTRFHYERLEQDLAAAKREQAELDTQLAAIQPSLLKKARGGSKASASTLERELVAARARLEALGELDQEVATEHAEVQRRHGELTKQIADLERAQTDLDALAQQLDEAITAQFSSGFQQISDGFSRHFTELFGGGSAKLTLDKSGEELGVEIEVVPPGKRVRHLRSLSGGERSLAGIALLAAIVDTHPSPVLVMDEVDAALDEANSARFERLLRKLSGSSQIVVITHNRTTMAAARRLYGVTMDGQHVSRMVSVKLAEAKALAASDAQG